LLIAIVCMSVTGLCLNLNCSSEGDSSWENGRIYTCGVKTKNLLIISGREDMLNTTSVDNSYLMKALEVDHQTVYYKPKFTGPFAGRIEALSFYSCKLKVISKDEFEQFPMLRQLKLIWNNLEWLNSDLFDFNKNIEVIDFYGNQRLKFIGANLLDLLPNLQKVNFQNCGCLDHSVFGPWLSDVKNALKTKCKSSLGERVMLSFLKQKQLIRDRVSNVTTQSQNLLSMLEDGTATYSP
jgi:hypothetical protein